MTRRKAVGAEVAGEAEQVGELHPLVTADAGNRGAAAHIFVSKALDHRVAEPAFIVEHIMGDTEPVGDRSGVVNVLSGAAGAGAPDRLAMVVELERDSDNFGAAARGECGHDRAVDAARHGDDDPRLAGRPLELEVRLDHRA
jgi:hypothetical protein